METVFRRLTGAKRRYGRRYRFTPIRVLASVIGLDCAVQDRNFGLALGEELRAEAYPGLLTGSDHAFDAALCVLSGLDFLMGEVVSRDDRTRAET